MNTGLLVYLIGVGLSLIYFLLEYYIVLLKKNLKNVQPHKLFTILVISLIFPLTWLIIALDALGLYNDKHHL